MVITWSGPCSSHRDSVWKVLEAQQTTASLGKDKQLETGGLMVDLLGVCPGHHLRTKMSPRGFGQDLDGDTSVGLKVHLARLAAGRRGGRWLGLFRRERIVPRTRWMLGTWRWETKIFLRQGATSLLDLICLSFKYLHFHLYYG